jgi:DNA-directed RNA polymerase specialized sigma subunit
MAQLGGRLLMKIPKNLTEEETLSKIELVVNRIAPKYSFVGYDINDIKQEAYIICMDALERYDQKRPLENFLAVNLSNRLKNFVRDNFCNKNSDEDKKKVMCPSYISNEDLIAGRESPAEHAVYMKEIEEIIDHHLPANMRMTYLRYKNGLSITKNKREELLTFLKSIFQKDDDNEEG